jgi:hypothetical protein
MIRALLSIGSLAATMAALPVLAAGGPIDPETRLVARDGVTYVRLSGRGRGRGRVRSVSVEGHPVATEGRDRWRADLPLTSVKRWAAPHASTLRVAVAGAAGTTIRDIRLPVGLLASPTELAALEITAP